MGVDTGPRNMRGIRTTMVSEKCKKHRRAISRGLRRDRRSRGGTDINEVKNKIKGKFTSEVYKGNIFLDPRDCMYKGSQGTAGHTGSESK